MSIFPKQTANKKKQRPRLYIVASRPSRANQPQSCEWSFEISSTIAAPHKDKHGLKLLGRKQKELLQTNIADTATQKHYYFNRMNHGNYTTEQPSTLLRIFLCSLPERKEAHADRNTYLTSFMECFEHVYMTPDAAPWLRQVLFSLQISELIPPTSRGLDINNFMSFAISSLEGLVLHETLEPGSIKEINYPNVLRHNRHLKRTTGMDGTSYAMVGENDDLLEESDAEDDIWGSSMQEGERKHWGFWVTHGSNGSRSQGSDVDGEMQPRAMQIGSRRDVYGGLM